MKRRLLKITKNVTLAAMLLLATRENYAQTGASLNFDGVDDNVNLGTSITSTLTNATVMTVEAWVYPTTNTGTGAIVTNHQSTTQFALRRIANNYDFMVGFGTYNVTSSATVNLNTWQHVAGVFNGTSISIYVDGVLSGTTPFTSYSLQSSSTSVIIGVDGFGEPFQGNIDEVRIWNVGRSQTLIQSYMNCAVSDTASGLLAYYEFNDGTANGNNAGRTTLFDGATNKVNGTLTNFALNGSTSNYVADYKSNYLSLQSSVGSTNCNNTLGNAIAADFTGDGAKDIIATDWNANTRLYVNAGHGNFSNSYTTVTTSAGTYSAGDFDKDGDLDLVVANGAVRAFANDGSGIFTDLGVNLLHGSGGGSVVKLADLNGDTKLDLIVGNNTSGTGDSTEIWLNTGTTGNAAFTYKCGLDNGFGGKNSIAVGDLNSDGFIDIVTGASSFPAMVFFNNNNSGTFSKQQSPPGYGGGVKLVDWNKDGKLDYMSYDSYNNVGLRVILNDGSGIFTGTPTQLLQSPTSNNCYLADLNGDGFLDAVLDHWGGNAYVYISNGCALTNQTACNYSLGKADNGVALADFNGDGTIDLFCQARCEVSSFYMNYLVPVTTPALPQVSITGNTLVNYGSSVVLTASGANSYLWSANAGSVTSSSVTITSQGTATYTVTGSNTVGCSDVAQITVSNKGAALNFDGIDDNVDLGTSITSSLTNSTAMTVEAWVYSTTNTGIGAIVTNHQNSTQFALRRNANNYEFLVGFATYIITSTATVNLNTWQHVVGVFNGTSISIYVDGTLSGTTSFSAYSLQTSSTPVKMGVDAFGEQFQGSLDEVRIWNRALCPNEIQSNMNGELKMPQTGLLGYYKFNQGIGGGNNSTVTVAADSSGNGINGTLSNFTLNGTTSNWVVPGAVTSGTYASGSPCVTTGITSNITQINENKVWPNPSNAILNLESGKELGEVRIYNMLNELLYNETFNSTSTSIDISNLNQGVYNLVINNRTIKFIKAE
jgi:hypothetical protein